MVGNSERYRNGESCRKRRNSRHRERRWNSEVYSNVNTEESSVWVCPVNEERGFVAYIFS